MFTNSSTINLPGPNMLLKLAWNTISSLAVIQKNLRQQILRKMFYKCNISSKGDLRKYQSYKENAKPRMQSLLEHVRQATENKNHLRSAHFEELRGNKIETYQD